MSSSVEELFENEWYIIRHSGETPEIAYNSAIYFLSRSVEGPKINLNPQQISSLKLAAVQRYKEIVLRDLNPENFDKSIYRGMARSICNYRRFCNFCNRQHIDPIDIKKVAASALHDFLELALRRVMSNDGLVEINCGFSELQRYAAELEVELSSDFKFLEQSCQQEE